MRVSDIFSSNTNEGYIYIYIYLQIIFLKSQTPPSLEPFVLFGNTASCRHDTGKEDFEHWFASSVMRGKTKN